MKVLVTGCAGFIGSMLADRLIFQGHEVWGMDTFETGLKENVNADVEFLQHDISDGLASLGSADLIIHCAASYKNPTLWPDDVETNIYGGINVAAAAREWNARIIYFQTVLPPISSYAISKIAGEHYLRLSGQPLTVFRLAAVYGPRNLSGAIPTFYKQIKAGLPCTVVEDASRDFVFIEDLVDTVMSNIDSTRTESIDVRTGIETRILEIPQMIGQLLESEYSMKLIPRPAHDVPHYEIDGPPLYKPQPFYYGLAKAVKWYEQNGVQDTYTHLGALDEPST